MNISVLINSSHAAGVTKMRIRESARGIIYFKASRGFRDQLSLHAKLGLRIIYARANREKSRINEVAFRIVLSIANVEIDN